ncbi:MAG: aminopeptidase [Spirochaetaceae bacterium]|jgi:predicted aminopeptidase|nr:aminopeptidase [Spirochaetaceae bacterium]
MKTLATAWWVYLPALMVVLLIVSGAALFSGCYTLKQGAVMLGYLNRAVPLESLLEEGDTSGSGVQDEEAEKTRRFVEQVYDIRRFATEELGLRESKNYTRYVELDRDYLAAVVSASAKDSFTTHEWWFPVVGRVPYKGFFNPDDARKEAGKLAKKDLDVWIRPVDAFSTLGWFRDPLYSYMRDYPVHALADLIIHELFHATVYIKSNSQFNEELAEFVGSRGSRLYIESRYGSDSDEYRAQTNPNEDNAAFVAFIHELIARLEALYSGGGDRETILEQKALIIKAAQERFEAEYESRFSSENYRFFSTLPVNNAYLALYRLYYAKDNYLEELMTRSGVDLKTFIAAAKTIPKKGDPRAHLEEALTGAR